MEKVRDRVFSAIACMALLLPLLHVAAGALLDGYEVKERSDLENRTYQEFAKLSPESFADGSFQGAMEGYLADHTPKRNGITMANASLQRTLIETANLPFGFEAYPSFFGSSRVIVPEMQAIFQMPSKADAKALEDAHRCADGIAELAARNPGTAWRIAPVDASSTSVALPANNLVSMPADYDFYRSELLARAENANPDVEAVDLSVSSPDEYLPRYFATDHHWRIEGGVEAYRRIMRSLGTAPLSYSYSTAYGGPFYGSNARTGLFAGYSDSIADVSSFEAAESISVTVNGQEQPAEWIKPSLAEGFSGAKKVSRYENMYARSFHGDFAMIEIFNGDIDEESALLIVGDSYTNCIDCLFAAHYRNVYIVDPRHLARDGYADWDISSFIDEKGVSAVVLLGGPSNLIADVDTLLGA